MVVVPPELNATSLGRALAGGRQTQDLPGAMLPAAMPVVVPPAALDDQWRALRVDRYLFDRLTGTEALDMLADMSPDVSRALFDHQRMFNPGFAYHARPLGADKEAKDIPEAMAALGRFFDRLRDLYGSVDVPINRLVMSGYMRGAYLGELVLDGNGREPIDLATPDPATVRFRRETDPLRGQVYRAGQWQFGRFVVFDRPTVRYVPIDPFPGSPYGRPLASPALFAAVFLLGLLHDLRRVVQQQGYPRIDVAVKMQELTNSMPIEVRGNRQQWTEWVNATVAEVQAAYGKLEPDDTYVHTDTVQVNRPVGTVDTSSLGAVDGLITALERWLARALKTTPLLMGLAEGTSEANANRQWEIFAAGVKALQHLCESLLERLLELALRAQGIQADVEFRFAELRAAELLRDEQVRTLRDENNAFEELMGWRSHDEAAEDAVGHAAEGEIVAMPSGFSSSTDPNDVQAEPGENRGGPAAGKVYVLDRNGALRKLPLPGFVDAPLDAAAALWDATVEDEYDGLLTAELAEAA